MITFITAFKPFDLIYLPIQRSALFSYKANKTPVIAADTEGDAKKVCLGFPNVTLLTSIKTAKDLGFNNQSPILKDLLIEALKGIKTPLVGLLNSDILIPMGFKKFLQGMLKKTGDHGFTAFTRYDLNLDTEIKTVKGLRKLFTQESTIYDEATSSDLFISSYENFKKIAEEIPEFILGRYGWDNWIHSFAEVNFRCFNGTKALKILHCRHDHSHITSQEGNPGKSAVSSAYNISLLKPIQEKYGIEVRIQHWEKI
jgi:calcineurin-like phosphoesterase family protein